MEENGNFLSEIFYSTDLIKKIMYCAPKQQLAYKADRIGLGQKIWNFWVDTSLSETFFPAWVRNQEPDECPFEEVHLTYGTSNAHA